MISSEMHHIDPRLRTANLLNVLAAMLTDALAAADLARSASETAALITIASYPGQSVKALATILGLSHSATVRLVEKLGDDGLVAVARGQDRRQRAVSISEAGRDVTVAILERRRARLVPLLAALDAGETAVLSRLLEKLIIAETRSPADGDRLCRFCDLANCPQAICPVEQEACRLRAAAPT